MPIEVPAINVPPAPQVTTYSNPLGLPKEIIAPLISLGLITGGAAGGLAAAENISQSGSLGEAIFGSIRWVNIVVGVVGAAAVYVGLNTIARDEV